MRRRSLFLVPVHSIYNPPTMPTLTEQADAAYQDQKFHAAVDYYRQLVADTPDDAFYLERLSDSLYAVEQYREALPVEQRLLTLLADAEDTDKGIARLRRAAEMAERLGITESATVYRRDAALLRDRQVRALLNETQPDGTEGWAALLAALEACSVDLSSVAASAYKQERYEQAFYLYATASLYGALYAEQVPEFVEVLHTTVQNCAAALSRLPSPVPPLAHKYNEATSTLLHSEAAYKLYYYLWSKTTILDLAQAHANALKEQDADAVAFAVQTIQRQQSAEIWSLASTEVSVLDRLAQLDTDVAPTTEQVAHLFGQLLDVYAQREG